MFEFAALVKTVDRNWDEQFARLEILDAIHLQIKIRLGRSSQLKPAGLLGYTHRTRKYRNYVYRCRGTS